MNFLFTCGGTAGHINPALAVAGILRDRMPDCGILFVGANGKMETDLVPRAGYDIVTVEVTNIHRARWARRADAAQQVCRRRYA